MAEDRNGPRTVTPAQYRRLRAWSQRKPCVALMGEFSAGKSTLLNFLVEEDVLPTRATATELPPVWLSHGNGGSYWVDGEGRNHPLDLSDLYRVEMDARFIRIYTNAEILEHCDLVDTPGISDPNLAVESWRFAAGVANMVLWCTSATQAWRQTERSAWTSLPERLQKHSLLIVTRSDKIAPADRTKVARRLARETEGLFNANVFLSTPDAVKAKEELTENESSPLWEESGAASLLDNLAERFEAIYEERAAMFSRYEKAGGPALEVVRNEPTQDEAPVPEAAPAEAPATTPEPVADIVSESVEVPAAATETDNAAAFEAAHEEVADVAPAPVPDVAQDATVQEEVSAISEIEPAAPEAVQSEPVVNDAPAAEIEEPAEPEPVGGFEAAGGDPAVTEAEVETTGNAEAEMGTGTDVPEAVAVPSRPSRPEAESPRRTERPSAAEADEMLARLQGELSTTDDVAAEAVPEPPVEELTQPSDADTVSALAQLMADEASLNAVQPTAAPEASEGSETSDLPETPDASFDAGEEEAVAAPAEAEHEAPEAAELETASEEKPETNPEASEEDPYVLKAEHAVEDGTGVPREVAMWREIVSHAPVSPANEQMIAMIDELLQRLYGAQAAPDASETAPDRALDGEGQQEERSTSGWRRLA